MWFVIVLIPDHCLSVYFLSIVGGAGLELFVLFKLFKYLKYLVCIFLSVLVLSVLYKDIYLFMNILKHLLAFCKLQYRHRFSLQRKPLPNGSETPAKLCVLLAFEHRF